MLVETDCLVLAGGANNAHCCEWHVQRQRSLLQCLWRLTVLCWRGEQATFQDLANRLYNTPEVSTSSRFSKPKLSQTAFTIEHYAGAVSYKTDNFLIKNRDFVVAEHQALLQASASSYIRGLFPPDPEEVAAAAQVPEPWGYQQPCLLCTFLSAAREQMHGW
jgi:myosin heavy subunit